MRDLIDLDLFGEISGVGQFPDVVRDADHIHVYDFPHLVASLDTLIRSKRAAGRRKDEIALPELEALKEIKSRKPK
jgi:hypothetical protein